MATAENGAMSKSERDELGRLLRKKAALAKQQAKQRTADLLADFEEKLAAEYDPVDLGLQAVMGDVAARITQVAAEASAAIAAACEERGVPPRFRPSFDVRLLWDSRGENGTAKRRTELRHVAQTAAAAAERSAIAAIDVQALALEERLVQGQLRSYEARRFFESLPAVEALMPPLSVTDVKRLASAHGARTTEERARLGQLYTGPSYHTPALGPAYADEGDEA